MREEGGWGERRTRCCHAFYQYLSGPFPLMSYSGKTAVKIKKNKKNETQTSLFRLQSCHDGTIHSRSQKMKEEGSWKICLYIVLTSNDFFDGGAQILLLFSFLLIIAFDSRLENMRKHD